MSTSSIEFLPVSTITLPQLKAYAEASGDDNPIHQDEEAAKKVGLPGIIAHGMLVSGLMSERGVKWVKTQYPGKLLSIISTQTRFRAMTFLGDTVSVGGSVKSISANEVVLELQAKNQKAEILSTSTMVFTNR